MTEVATVETLTAEQAESLEAAFLGGLEEAQVAYERIVEHEAWMLLGFDSFTEWWGERVTPTMRALSMRPTQDMTRLAIEQVRAEDAELPPAQRRTQREVAEVVGVSQSTVSRSTPDAPASDPDLERTLKFACEACGLLMRADQVNAGYMRCDDCDSEGDHYSPTFPNGRNGQCVGCNPELEEGAEPALPPLPAGQDDADAILAALDKAAPAERPKPPKWDPEERRRHEEEVARIRDIEAARQQAKTIVTDVLAAVCVVVAGCRYGETGLITPDMITKLREAIDLLEGEL